MARDPDFIHFRLGESGDPDYLRQLLTAHFNYERLRRSRRFFVGLLGVLGCALWLGGGGLPVRLHTAAVQLWEFVLLVTAVLVVFEWRWYRRRERLLRRGRDG